MNNSKLTHLIRSDALAPQNKIQFSEKVKIVLKTCYNNIREERFKDN